MTGELFIVCLDTLRGLSLEHVAGAGEVRIPVVRDRVTTALRPLQVAAADESIETVEVWLEITRSWLAEHEQRARRPAKADEKWDREHRFIVYAVSAARLAEALLERLLLEERAPKKAARRGRA